MSDADPYGDDWNRAPSIRSLVLWWFLALSLLTLFIGLYVAGRG